MSDDVKKQPDPAVEPGVAAESDATQEDKAPVETKPESVRAEQVETAPAKMQIEEESGESTEAKAPAAAPDADREAKLKAAAEARAARAAAKAQAEGASGETAEAKAPAADQDADREAKLKAAAEARAARAAAKAKKEGDEPEAPKPPSPNQPKLDRMVELLKQEVAAEAVQEAYINEPDAHLPVLVIASEHWFACAELLKRHVELKLNYLRNLSGVDQETHMEVVYHLVGLDTKREACVKVKTDRDHPSVPSVTPIWSTADWPEREAYDLLGIEFPGHPDLRRIMLTDDWVGHPLRKDYEPIDPEV